MAETKHTHPARPMDRPFNVAIVGAGMGRIHAAALAEVDGARAFAICDLDLARAEALAADFAVEHAIADYDEILHMPDVHAVTLATPHHLHAQQIMAAAAAGKHVLVEKPLTVTLADAERVIEECRIQGVRLGVVFQNRYPPKVQALRRDVRDGLLGRVFLGQARINWERTSDYYIRGAWRGRKQEAGGGVLTTQGVHTLDLLEWFMGPVQSVSACTDRFVHPAEVEDTAGVLMRFAGGGLGVATASVAVHPESPATVELYGENGTAVIAEHRGVVEVAVRTRAGAEVKYPLLDALLSLADYEPQDPESPGLLNVNLHRRLFTEFFGCLAAGTAFPLDGEEGRKSVALLEAIYRSAEENRPCAVSSAADTGK